MKNRYRLYRRKLGGVFYVHDSETGKQESLGTRDRAEATTLLNARNESVRQPQLNLQIAKAYLAGTDSGVSDHGKNAKECEATIAAIHDETGIDEYALLWSVKEYKKTRVKYFTSDWDAWIASHGLGAHDLPVSASAPS